MQIEVPEIAKRLIKIPSVSRYESVLGEEIEALLKPIPVRRQKVRDIGFNIISEYRVSDSLPTIVLNGHMDTVEPTDGWETEVYSPEMIGNKLYGLGAADMKGGLAALLWAYKKSVKQRVPVNLIFTAVVDEEINSEGAYELLKEVDGDLAIIAEPTGEKTMLGARGRYVLDITVRGKSAHGARPSLGINAIECCARIIEKIKEIKTLEGDIGRGSITPLKIQGGGDFLSVPDLCYLVIDRHVVPSETREKVMREIMEVVESPEISCEVDVSWHPRPTPFLEPYVFSGKEPWIRDFLTFYKEVYGKNEIIYGESVGDYNLFAKKIPTVVYGPEGGNWHSPNEFVYVDSLIRVGDFYYEFIKSIGERYERKDA